MWQSVKILNVLITLTLKQMFWKTKTFFKKMEYGFLVESTGIENVSFPYKIVMSEANVKTNRMVNIKLVLPVTTLVFWKCCFSLRTSYKKLIQCTNYPNVHIHTFCKCWSFIWGCFFPVSILRAANWSSYFFAERFLSEHLVFCSSYFFLVTTSS